MNKDLDDMNELISFPKFFKNMLKSGGVGL
ncbi:MAG: hypothetical protein PWP52_1568 [Bacteroidales bacterium]|jgi:hypothetical protein|nr:hypothetical protein [Bacteroidales bacterium]